ncbi:MAG TPA: hypothetical protein VIS28_06130, partial [Nitrososphaeraceae archaeon]
IHIILTIREYSENTIIKNKNYHCHYYVSLLFSTGILHPSQSLIPSNSTIYYSNCNSTIFIIVGCLSNLPYPVGVSSRFII